MPLGFLGTFWRFIRQSWTDVELVLDILKKNEAIQEVDEPIIPKIEAACIEFKNVCFTYEKNEKKEN